MNAFLFALIVWSLPFLGISCGSQTMQNPSVQSQTTPIPTQETVTLTNQDPIRSFPLQPDQLSHPPEILEVSVTKVVNPALSPVSIFVYAAPADGKRKAEAVEIGNFSLYPLDRPGKFLLNPEAALRKSSGKINPTSDDKWQLRFVLQLPEQNKSDVEVTIASPKWQSKTN